jgi:hypothetical protein
MERKNINKKILITKYWNTSSRTDSAFHEKQYCNFIYRAAAEGYRENRARLQDQFLIKIVWAFEA